MSSYLRRSLVSASLLSLLFTLPSCAEEVNQLVDVDGVWTLKLFNLDGTNAVTVDATYRENAFLLNFDASKQVVAAGTCTADGGNSYSVSGVLCQNNPSASWACRCFAYDYEDELMRWQEFEPGTPAPDVDGIEIPEMEEEGVVTNQVKVEKYSETPGRYSFRGLPETLFDSYGDASNHIFDQRADSVWFGADMNNDGTDDPELAECAVQCFGG